MSKPAFNSLSAMLHWSQHKRILLLALPMILANITTPLIGLVDTAVLGHMPQVHYLAGAAIGAFILTQIYWICGFVRMTTTGLSAQAKGEDRGSQQQANSATLLKQSLFVSAGLGLAILLGQQAILALGMLASAPEQAVAESIRAYFLVRVWGAPLAMMNMALMGWLIGQQQARQVMYIQIAVNILNVVLNLIFVFALELGVSGVALASVFAELSAVVLALVLALRHLHIGLDVLLSLPMDGLNKLVKLNSHMFVRNLALQLCLAFVTFQGARLGESTAALNAILMQFFVLIALGLDGLAHAVEALLGEAKGARQAQRIAAWVYAGLLWSGAFAVAYSLGFWLFAEQIFLFLTDKSQLHQSFLEYLPVLLALPLVGHWCFMFDAVFIGLTRAQAMQNSMLFSCLMVFFPVWWWSSELANMGLWLALLAFLAARGVTLGGYFIYLEKKAALLD